MRSTTTADHAGSSRSAGRRRTAPAALAVLLLALTACGGGSDAASTVSAAGGAAQDSASSAPSEEPDASVQSNAADVSFLTGMVPHHQQAVEMSDLVLAADPPAAVARLAERVKAAQAPEIELMEQMLVDLGEEPGHGGHGGAAHGGMTSAADLQQLGQATGDDAAHLYLAAMIEHHRGAIEAAEKQIAGGVHEPARELARTIAETQAIEIAEMQALLDH